MRVAANSEPRWRELYRCEDLLKARAVATSVAAMEFDVRLSGPEGDDLRLDRGPSSHASAMTESFVIEVPDEQWSALAGVLREIIAEQDEFDAWIEQRRDQRRPKLFMFLLTTGLAEIVIMWRLLEP